MNHHELTAASPNAYTRTLGKLLPIPGKPAPPWPIQRFYHLQVPVTLRPARAPSRSRPMLSRLHLPPNPSAFLNRLPMPIYPTVTTPTSSNRLPINNLALILNILPVRQTLTTTRLTRGHSRLRLMVEVCQTRHQWSLLQRELVTAASAVLKTAKVKEDDLFV